MNWKEFFKLTLPRIITIIILSGVAYIISLMLSMARGVNDISAMLTCFGIIFTLPIYIYLTGFYTNYQYYFIARILEYVYLYLFTCTLFFVLRLINKKRANTIEYTEKIEEQKTNRKEFFSFNRTKWQIFSMLLIFAALSTLRIIQVYSVEHIYSDVYGQAYTLNLISRILFFILALPVALSFMMAIMGFTIKGAIILVVIAAIPEFVYLHTLSCIIYWISNKSTKKDDNTNSNNDINAFNNNLNNDQK